MQEALNYNYVFIGLFQKVLSGQIPLTSNFSPGTVCYNYYSFKDQVGK